jgi:3-hydroxyisobutyrate dehydrogenase-like beta-hydroxyacid dehydrogenase
MNTTADCLVCGWAYEHASEQGALGAAEAHSLLTGGHEVRVRLRITRAALERAERERAEVAASEAEKGETK